MTKLWRQLNLFRESLTSELDRITGSQSVLEHARFGTSTNPWHLFQMVLPPNHELLARNLLNRLKVVQRKEDTSRTSVDHPKVSPKTSKRTTDRKALKAARPSSSVIRRSDRDSEKDHNRRRAQSTCSRSPTQSRSQANRDSQWKDTSFRGNRGSSGSRGRGGVRPGRPGDSKAAVKSSGNASRQKETEVKAEEAPNLLPARRRKQLPLFMGRPMSIRWYG